MPGSACHFSFRYVETMCLVCTGQVSKVPFALRRAVCQCQANFGPQEGQDALYSLLEHCQQRSEGQCPLSFSKNLDNQIHS